MRIGFLGPTGTFSHEAVRATAGTDGAQLVALETTHDVVVAVQDGRVDRAAAPLENSLEGEVTAVVDALALSAPDVVVTGEHVLAVRLCLAAAPDGPDGLAAVREVVSHPQPLGQCADWLREHVARAQTTAAPSTVAALRAALGAPAGAGVAAIAPLAAAAEHGAAVLADDVADEAPNATRFVWLARADGGPAAVDPFPARADGAWRTSVLFHGAGDGDPGWLVRCLSELAFRGVNLTRIASRPSRRRLGHYVFHVDMDGRFGADGRGPVAEGVEALRAHCEEVRLLGTYPAAAG